MPAAALLLLAAPAGARVLLSQKEALSIAFPGGQAVERRTAYLDDGQLARASRLARARVESRVWTYYVGRSSSGITGYAYFESHVVRTMPEAFMAALDAEGRLRFVEILSFAEPEDYLPRRRWLDQFRRRGLDEDLFVSRGLRNIAGATLTARALAEGVRRALAVHAVIHGAVEREAPGR